MIKEVALAGAAELLGGLPILEVRRRPEAAPDALGGPSLQQHIAEGEVKELPIVIKADVQGSAEVLGERTNEAKS